MIVAGEVFDEAFADFPSEVEAGKAGIFLFDEIHDAKALAIVLEAAVLFHELIESGFAFVAEGRMAEIVSEGDSFSEVFVDAKGAGNIAGDTGDFHGVGESGAEMVAGAVKENLGFIFEAAKGAGMDDAVAVALVMGAPFGWRFVVDAAAGGGAELGVRGEELPFALFEFGTRDRHKGIKS